MSWLVTGGAGYIGAHVVRALAAAGLPPVVLDDLSSGHRGFVPDGVPFVEGTILDRELVERTLREHDGDRRHPCRRLQVRGVSVQRPLHTYAQNVEGTRVVLEAMQAADVANIVFSSSAAVYGTPDVELVTEDLPKRPASPLRRVEADRRMAAARSGDGDGRRRSIRCATRRCATSTWSARRIPRSTTRARTTCSRSCSRRSSRAVPRASTATTTTLPTARTCATTCMWATSRRRTSSRRSGSKRASRSRRRTTSARATACRCARSWTRWPA